MHVHLHNPPRAPAWLHYQSYAQACVGAKASVKTDAKSTDKAAATEENCDALNVQQQAAVLVQKYVEKARPLQHPFPQRYLAG